MDLFYSGLTPDQQLRKLTKEIKTKLDITHNVVKKSTKSFKLYVGSKESFGNCVMFLLPHPTTKGIMGSVAEKALGRYIRAYKIQNAIITYCYHKMCSSVTAKQIKESTNDINTMISIVSPKMIVLLGADTILPFQNKKPKIDDIHGTIVSDHNGAPLIITYHPSYYTTRSGYEDDRYKQSLMKDDWTFIKKHYDKLIGE